MNDEPTTAPEETPISDDQLVIAGLPEAPPEDVAPKKRGPGRPRKDPADKAPKKAPPGRPPGGSKKEAMKKDLTGLITFIGMGVGTVGSGAGNERLAFDGAVIVAEADALAEAWTDLAQKNPAVASAINALCTGQTFSGVLMTTAAVAVPILMCHGIVPVSDMALAASGLPADLLSAMPAPPEPPLAAVVDLDAPPADDPPPWAPPVVT